PALAPGPPTSCVGTTSTIATAASATSARRSATRATITRSSQRGTPSTSRLVNATRPAGRDTRATGRPSARSRSTPSATRWLPRHRTTKIYSRWLHDRGDNYLDARRMWTAAWPCAMVEWSEPAHLLRHAVASRRPVGGQVGGHGLARGLVGV